MSTLPQRLSTLIQLHREANDLDYSISRDRIALEIKEKNLKKLRGKITEENIAVAILTMPTSKTTKETING